MSLQSRLFAFFVLIVVVPLGVATILGQRIFVRELEERTHAQLIPAQLAAVTVYDQRVSSAKDRVQVIASTPEFNRLLLAGDYAGIRRFLLGRISGEEAVTDFIVLSAPDGTVLVDALSDASYLAGVKPPGAEEIVSENLNPSRRYMFTRSIVPLDLGSGATASLLGGYYLDNDFVRELARNTGADASVFLDSKAISSTLASVLKMESPVVVDLISEREESFLKTTIGGERVYAVAGPLGEEVPTKVATMLLSTSQQPILDVARTVRTSTIILLVLAAAGAAFLGLSLARLIARPLRELAAGADAIASGNYDQHIGVRSTDEVGALARAFNEMAGRLSVHITELKDSRDELKRSLARLGETLRSTHDLERMLQVVLETGVDTLRAERGVLLWTGQGRGPLVKSVARGIPGDLILQRGEGIAGHVAATGEPVRIPDSDVKRSVAEPEFRTSLSVPIFSQERVAAVLSLYDKEGGGVFTDGDMGTLLSITDQAGVAIENVLLHQEARLQATMDGLTGIWNYRYFHIRFDQELERSARFKRSVSLIILDLDDFKSINDNHGHLRGDSVLIELARRVRAEIRDIDLLARYGGEEFVLILPETDVEGGLRTAQKIRAAIASEVFDGEPPLPVTISAGLACFPDHGAEPQLLLRNADTALYEAKGAGKNQVVAFGSEKAARG